jgi:hypothetical protein
VSDGLFELGLDENGRGFESPQCEGGAADAHHERIAAEPHARDDFTACPAHEPQVAQARSQERDFRFATAQGGIHGEARDNGSFAATQVRERDGRSGGSVDSGHGRKYAVAGDRM